MKRKQTQKFLLQDQAIARTPCWATQRRRTQSSIYRREESIETITDAAFTKVSNTTIKTGLFAALSKSSMNDDSSHVHQVNCHTSHFIFQKLAVLGNHRPMPDANWVDKATNKMSEINVSMARNFKE